MHKINQSRRYPQPIIPDQVPIVLIANFIPHNHAFQIPFLKKYFCSIAALKLLISNAKATTLNPDNIHQLAK